MSCSAIPPPDLDDPLRLNPEWQTGTVLALACGIATDNAFDRLPILADALEESGCDNKAMLDHLRSAEPHRDECWALRALLRTTLLLPDGVPITFAYCPPGSFLMGSDHPEAVKFADERPVHRVTLTKGFYAGIYTVTQAQWRAVMGTNPSEFVGDDRPVEKVEWEEASEFCRRVSELTGRPIRLPQRRSGSTPVAPARRPSSISAMSCRTNWRTITPHRRGTVHPRGSAFMNQRG